MIISLEEQAEVLPLGELLFRYFVELWKTHYAGKMLFIGAWREVLQTKDEIYHIEYFLGRKTLAPEQLRKEAYVGWLEIAETLISLRRWVDEKGSTVEKAPRLKFLNDYGDPWMVSRRLVYLSEREQNW